MDPHSKRRVVVDYNATGTDIVSLTILLVSPNVEVLGIMITPASCFVKDSIDVTFQLLSLLGKTHIPVAMGNIYGINPYPDNKRIFSKMMTALPALIVQDISNLKLNPKNATDFLIDLCEKEKEPFDVLVLGPPVNLAVALKDDHVRARIGKIVFQGGNLGEVGNVIFHNSSEKAEFKLYWHSVLAKKFFEKAQNLIMVPIENAKSFEGTEEFPKWIGLDDNSVLSDLIGSILAQNIIEYRLKSDLFLSELLGAYYFVHPEILQLKDAKVSIKTNIPEEGVLRFGEGHPIKIGQISKENATNFAKDIIKMMKSNKKIRSPSFEIPADPPAQEYEGQKDKIFIDHDGAVDDLFALMIIFAQKHVDIRGISVVGADCVLEDGIEMTLKLLSMYDLNKVPVAATHLNIKNNFPMEWRVAARCLLTSPILINQKYDKNLLSKLPSHELLIKILEEAKDNEITVFVSGPMINVGHVVKTRPDLVKKISKVVCMGGAIFVDGNVMKYSHNGSAEWNVYTDPVAYKNLLESKVPVYMYSLDSTNNVPLSFELLKDFSKQKMFSASKFLSFALSLTTCNIPSKDYTYFFWDALAASYFLENPTCKFKTVEIDVDLEPPSEGRTKPAPGSGFFVNMAYDVDLSTFYPSIKKLLRMDLHLIDE